MKKSWYINKNFDKFFSQRARYLSLVCLSFFLMSILFTGVVFASTVSESFKSQDNYQVGTIVSYNPADNNEISLSSLNNREYLLGVVTEASDSGVSFVKDNSSIYVALSGEVDVYVSNVNGSIKTGDLIGPSWLEGIGMRSDDIDRTKLLGVARENLDFKNAKEYGEIETSSGKKTVKVASVKVRLFDREGINDNLSNKTGIEKIMTILAGKDVSIFRIIVVSFVFIVSLVVSSVFIYSAIKGGFISIGRNPMASTSIHKGMLHISITSISIILMGTILSYVILVF